MRYYLQISQKSEVKARMEYLFKVFHTYFAKEKCIRDFICFKDMPFTNDGICFITGHNNSVLDLLSYGNLSEKIIVLNTCTPELFRRFVSNTRKIFFCDTICNYALPRFAEYGFDFDMLDSELFLYLSKKEDTLKRIEDSYKPLGRR